MDLTITRYTRKSANPFDCALAQDPEGDICFYSDIQNYTNTDDMYVVMVCGVRITTGETCEFEFHIYTTYKSQEALLDIIRKDYYLECFERLRVMMVAKAGDKQHSVMVSAKTLFTDLRK